MKAIEIFEKKLLDISTPSSKTLAKKYRVSIAKVDKEIARGSKVELEHTSDPKVAREIASDHVAEDLYYYEKLATAEKG